MTSTRQSRPIPFVALVLGWLIPGAGHVYLGRHLRGAIIFLIIGATFWAGVAIGGVLTVDYQNERWWFAGQMLTGMHGIIGWHRQQKLYAELAADSEVGLPPPRGTSPQRRDTWTYRLDKRLAEQKLSAVAPADTIARAYAGVAGLLNLMCVFDAVMLSLLGITGETKPAPEDEKKEQQQR
jgi:TM2 domain-containing membrane protein YozV